MNVQRVERISDFVRDTGGEQRERLYALALDGCKGLLPRLGRVVQNERDAGTAGGFAVKRRSIEPQKSWAWIMHFKFVACDAFTTGSPAREIFSQSTSGSQVVMCCPRRWAANQSGVSRPD